MLSSHLYLLLPSGLFSSEFSTKILYASHMHAKCSIEIILDLGALIIFGADINYEALHYENFSSLLLFPLFLVLILSSEPCSQTPLICVLHFG
jgi:hypothetical protein